MPVRHFEQVWFLKRKYGAARAQLTGVILQEVCDIPGGEFQQVHLRQGETVGQKLLNKWNIVQQTGLRQTTLVNKVMPVIIDAPLLAVCCQPLEAGAVYCGATRAALIFVDYLQPSSMARSRRLYWRSVLSRFSDTCNQVDCLT
jgi:hypothetical protein